MAARICRGVKLRGTCNSVNPPNGAFDRTGLREGSRAEIQRLGAPRALFLVSAGAVMAPPPTDRLGGQGVGDQRSRAELQLRSRCAMAITSALTRRSAFRSMRCISASWRRAVNRARRWEILDMSVPLVINGAKWLMHWLGCEPAVQIGTAGIAKRFAGG